MTEGGKETQGYIWGDNGGVWEKLSPRQLEHRPALPAAITIHRLVPKPHLTNTARRKSSVVSFKVKYRAVFN